MERRRKALGLRKLCSNDEEKPATSSVTRTTTSTNVKNETEAGKRSQMHQKGSVTPRNSKMLKDSAVPRANVTPNQTTPKTHKNLCLKKTESPASPLASPSPSQHAMVIHKMFGSPEVEVSWDWGCSQLVNQIVPIRRSTRVNQMQPIPVPDSVTSYPRLPPNKQMSEEENQERLAFYKNILSKSLKRNQKDSNKNNNNIDKEDPNFNNTTPKRPQNHKTESTKKDQVNAFFDDSANEFMLECSQVIEEQLRNGEIGLGSVINIEIGSKKHPHSPIVEPENVVKKICNGKTKQNLFPESTNYPDLNHINHNKKSNFSLKSPKVKSSKINSNCDKASLHPNEIKSPVGNDNDVLFMKPTQTSKPPIVKNFFEKDCTNVNKNGTGSIQSVASSDKDATLRRANSKQGCSSSDKMESCIIKNSSSNEDAKRLLQSKMSANNKFVTGENRTNVNANGNGNTLHYDSVNKFRRSQNGGLPTKLLNTHERKSCDTIVMKTVISANSAFKAGVKEDNNSKGGPNVSSKGLVKVTKPKNVDVTPLLDDGFDMDLCSLDFDTLCCNSQQRQPNEPQRQAVVKTVPKLCSEQEIEAKRLAALNRLLMKKKK